MRLCPDHMPTVGDRVPIGTPCPMCENQTLRAEVERLKNNEIAEGDGIAFLREELRLANLHLESFSSGLSDALKSRDAALLQVDELRAKLKDSEGDHRQIHGLQLQNGELKNSLRHLLDVCHDYLTHKDQQNVAAYLQAAKEALEPLTPVEGQPGEVCGPCGVSHPVAEKRKDVTPLPEMKRHPFTCGECRAEIRTDVCPACAGKRKDDTRHDPRSRCAKAIDGSQQTCDLPPGHGEGCAFYSYWT